MSQTNNYQLLIKKLDGFIRKYYINQIIRGSLYSLGLVLLLFLVVNLLEYNFFFDTTGRKLLFFSFIGISLLAVGGWVVKPLLHYFHLGKIISHEQAANIIGQHFSNVKDKLLNVLQLRAQSESAANKDLILASIDQKSEEIRPVPFKTAINLQNNRRYLKYTLPPLLAIVVILFAAPSIISDSTKRLLNNSKEFERPAPFQFKLLQEQELKAVQFTNFPIQVEVEGEQLPNDVFIEVDDYEYRLSKESANRFSFQFNNVQKDLDFRLYSGTVSSKDFELKVLKKPNINSFEAKLDYPAYTGRKDESLANIGDLTIPVGTKIDWVFNAENTDGIQLRFSGEGDIIETKRFSDDLFTYQRRILKDETYKLYTSNDDLPLADSVAYALSVIPDLYPEISVEAFQDSSQRKVLFFAGEASDDYGLLSLTFNYIIKPEKGPENELVSLPLDKKTGKQIRYDYTFDINELGLKPGDQITYYFEVYDNDAVNGNKSSRTGLMQYNLPTKKEYEEMAEANDDKIKDKLRKSLEDSRKLQDDMKEMREKLLQEKEVDWKTKKELEKIMERQQQLQNQIEDARQSYEENLQNQEEFSETQESIQEKQEKIQELFDEVMSEEMKELMKQIEELMEQLEKDEALEMMEDFEFNDEELEKELDRMLEMFKQLELEQEMQETIDKLEELAERQEELSEQTEQGEKDQEELQQEQEEINEEFNDLQEKMDKMEEKNQELENPKDMEGMDEQMEDINQDLQDSQEQLEQQNNEGASQSQKKAAGKMSEMANAMQMQMQSQQMEQMEEDMASLRQLLENLVGLSFDQEDLIKEFTKTEINTPRYVELVQGQFKLKDDFGLIEDSLQELSKRVFQIESFVTEKVSEIKRNIRESIDELEERRQPQAAENQQRTMTNVNDLAVMLSETMNQMQQQMSGMMSGNQMCQNPGGQGKDGQKPSDKISQGQQGLNDAMKRMKEGLEKGGKGGSSKEFAQMAARQAALRKALREKQRGLQQKGKGSKELQELIEEMDQVEEDLVNKRLTNEMIRRQEDILTRLLEHEKAERQRDLDDKRKSESARQRERQLPPSMEEYLKKREAEIEQFKTVSPSLKPYYKQLVEDYFKKLRAE